ncbi:MAG: tRNA pseudouridine(38-40) synthase TruA [Pseudomonadota bacterium]
MNRYKLTIEYKGGNFIGWQKQADNPNSIQEIIEKAIFDLTGEKVDLVGSGRTDAGVHALAQTAHFDLQKPTKENFAFKMRAGLNHYLRQNNITADIAILDCVEVDKNFHSRFDGKMRHYQYQIISRHPHLTLHRDLAWQISYPLDINEMLKAAQYLLGKHDFSSFRDSECQSKSAIKSIEKIEIFQEGDLVKMNFSAKSFLHHQVRNMVGTLVLVGGGRMKAEDVKMILETRDRTKSGSNAPAGGLYFLGVDYE